MANLATRKGAGFRASGTWQPLGNPVFRALWIAVLFSNIGNWMRHGLAWGEYLVLAALRRAGRPIA